MAQVYGPNSYAIVANTRISTRVTMADQRVYLIDPGSFHDPVPIVCFARGAEPTKTMIKPQYLRRYRIESVPEALEAKNVHRMSFEEAEDVLTIHEPFNATETDARTKLLEEYADE